MATKWSAKKPARSLRRARSRSVCIDTVKAQVPSVRSRNRQANRHVDRGFGRVDIARMTVHLIKMCVGIENVRHLRAVQANRIRQAEAAGIAPVFATRHSEYTPKRAKPN